MAADPDMKAMAEEEAAALKKRLPELEQAVKRMLLPKDADDEKNAILEIRAGTGGDEAALFAGDLFRMYPRYADEHGWQFEILELSDTGIGGYKEVIAAVTGERRVRPAQVRIGRAPRAARAGDRDAGPHPHLGGDRRGAAGGRGGRRRDRRQGPAHRRLPLLRRRAASPSTRPTRRCASPTSRPASWSTARTRSAQHKNKAKAMKILRARLYDAERQRRDDARAADAQGPGRHRRPQRAHPHLQLPAGPGHRPPHQPHALQARPR